MLDELKELNPKPIPKLSAEDARKQPTPADAVKALLKQKNRSTAPEKVADIDNRSIDGPEGDVKIRVYTPEGKGPFPLIVYYHGGGFVIADLDTYDASARALANAAKAVVVSSHYRQAPEHPFPAAHEDAFAAYQWALKNARALNGLPDQVAVAGESAGGNLAAAVCLMAQDQGVQMPVHQLLVYPMTNYAFDTASYQQNAEAKPLSRPMMQWFYEQALEQPADGSDPRLSVLRAEKLAGLPPPRSSQRRSILFARKGKRTPSVCVRQGWP